MGADVWWTPRARTGTGSPLLGCSRCGAAVSGEDAATHERWHAELDTMLSSIPVLSARFALSAGPVPDGQETAP